MNNLLKTKCVVQYVSVILHYKPTIYKMSTDILNLNINGFV